MNPRTLVLSTLVVWFIAAIIAAAFGVFDVPAGVTARAPLSLGLAVVLPPLIFAIGYLASPRFRDYILHLDPRILTLIQSWRVAGFVFLVLGAYGILPRVFALSAGWGDIFIGATAPFAATYLVGRQRRTETIAWQLLGSLDLVNAITLGVLSSPTRLGILAGGTTTRPMGLLPLSLIPTFIVPLLLIFHIICILQALKWTEQRRTHSAHAVAPAH
jgi:hypothetical protein